VFDFGSTSFVELREQIWMSVFEQACRSQSAGLIFTFAPEATVRPGFIQRMLRVIADGNGEVDFVELVCPLAELKRRLDSPSRLQYQKLTSVSLFERLQAAGSFDASHMPKPRVSIDSSIFSPAEAAKQITQTLDLGGSS
jgi:hypothetical protein